MPFEIVRNDITKMKVDAIVNTANPYVQIGSGTDSAIHAAAGPELFEERKAIGEIRVGQSVASKAYRLDAKYVFHTVSPSWIDGNHDERLLLRMAYDAALNLAVEKKCKSIAFPLMAAGSYLFPKDEALRIAIRAFTDFLMSHESMKIYLVIFNGKAFALAGTLFDDLKSYVDDNYVREQAKKEYSSRGRRQRIELEALQSFRMESEALCFEEDKMAMPNMASCIKERKAPVSSAPSIIIEEPEESFCLALRRMIQERGLKDSEIYGPISMSRQTFNKIITHPDSQPKKYTIVQIAFGMHLTVDETQELLSKAGYVLSRSSRKDLILHYYLDHEIYNPVVIDIALFDDGQTPLFS